MQTNSFLKEFEVEEKLRSDQVATTYKVTKKQESSINLNINHFSCKHYAQEKEILFYQEYTNQSEVQNHPNILKIRQVEKTQNNFYLIMDFCEQGTLSSYLKNRQSILEEGQVQFIAAQILSGLKYMRDKSIIHRNIRPESILISKEYRQATYKICEFSFSLNCQKQQNLFDVEKSIYSSPEIKNSDRFDYKTDL